MNAAAETFDTLWDYCTSDGRMIPKDWQRLHDMLANKNQKPSGGWQPSLPLILAARDVTMPMEKQLIGKALPAGEALWKIEAYWQGHQ